MLIPVHLSVTQLTDQMLVHLIRGIHSSSIFSFQSTRRSLAADKIQILRKHPLPVKPFFCFFSMFLRVCWPIRQNPFTYKALPKSKHCEHVQIAAQCGRTRQNPHETIHEPGLPPNWEPEAGLRRIEMNDDLEGTNQDGH